MNLRSIRMSFRFDFQAVARRRAYTPARPRLVAYAAFAVTEVTSSYDMRLFCAELNRKGVFVQESK